ncbi:predicted protein [Nematostella vectensis]|uniref:Proline-rich transmembrane protein 3/4 domain-containing protein n=1 Tax=Nematostella vectensis TaxID=45351 RepID=A7SXL8_NEMVE|nr:predicted protein [Nematostella vectensis]|eukprot:XP_001623665.1 predicted protein [Nematostella vectensis]
MSEPEPSSPRPERTPIPERSPTAEPEWTGKSKAEPIPDWTNATATWLGAWEVHWIGLGAMFTLLTLYAAFSIITMMRVKQKRRRIFSIFVSSMLLVFGISRAMFLFINPYESPQCYILPSCPALLTRILFGIGLPCLTAAFSFIQLVFLQVVEMRLYPSRIQSWKFLLGIIITHFSLAIVTEIIIFIFADWKSLSIACQVFFIVFSLALSSSFVYTGTTIIRHVQNSSRDVGSIGQRIDTEAHAHGGKTSLTKLVRITFLVAALGLVSCALQIYSIFAVYDIYKNDSPQPWPWWAFQTLFRCVELAAGCTMGYVSPRQTGNLKSIICCAHDQEKAVFYYTDIENSENAVTIQNNGLYNTSQGISLGQRKIDRV